jgi:hypothetical protein
MAPFLAPSGKDQKSYVKDQAHVDVSGAARVVTVRREEAPVARRISDGKHIYAFIFCLCAAEDKEQQSGGGKAEQGEAGHGRGLLVV